MRCLPLYAHCVEPRLWRPLRHGQGANAAGSLLGFHGRDNCRTVFFHFFLTQLFEASLPADTPRMAVWDSQNLIIWAPGFPIIRPQILNCKSLGVTSRSWPTIRLAPKTERPNLQMIFLSDSMCVLNLILISWLGCCWESWWGTTDNLHVSALQSSFRLGEVCLDLRDFDFNTRSKQRMTSWRAVTTSAKVWTTWTDMRYKKSLVGWLLTWDLYQPVYRLYCLPYLPLWKSPTTIVG